MSRMEQQWERLGPRLRADRETRGISQTDMATRLGVERNAIGRLEAGRGKRVTPTMRGYAREVGWSDDSIERVLAGGEPVYVTREQPETPTADEPGALPEGTPERTRQALAGSRLVDTAVIDLGLEREVELGNITLMYSRKPGQSTTPEEEREIMRRWARLTESARRIFAEDEPDS